MTKSEKFNFAISPDEKDPEGLLCSVEEILGELAEAGFKVGIEQEYLMVSSPQDRQSESLILFQHFSDKINVYALVGLVQLRESIAFQQGFDELKARMANLGWGFRHNSIDSKRTEVYTGDGVTIYYNCTLADLRALQTRVEQAELLADLYEHWTEFSEAGLHVSVTDDQLEITFQDSDPALKRYLTRRNLDWLLAITRAINELP